MKNFKLKTDRFRKARGGYSRFLQIFCEKCGEKIALYQKDGPGSLKRIYFDRIFSPHNLSGFEYVSLKNVPNLIYKNCRQVIGIPFLYQKEKKGSFRLFEGSVIKRIAKLK